MKKFLIQFTIFMLPIVIFGIAAEVLLRNIPNDYVYKKSHLDHYASNIEVLLLGNSHVYYGIDPQYLTEKSFNASHISQSINYDLEILKKYEKDWKSLKCVVISVDYFSLFTRLDEGGEAWRSKNYNIYYDIHTSHNILVNSLIVGSKLPVNLQRLYKYYVKGESDLHVKLNGWGVNHHSKNNENLMETGAIAAKKHTAESEEQYFEDNIKWLRELVFFAKRHHIKILLFTSPAYKSYRENINAKQMQRTVDVLKQLADANPSVLQYNNLIDRKEFQEQDFYDADHMNEIGAEKLSKAIDSLIE